MSNLTLVYTIVVMVDVLRSENFRRIEGAAWTVGRTAGEAREDDDRERVVAILFKEFLR
jgi:hypothetical protein